ncbi:MAG: response regulator transcription factor [Phycisphaerales bacterium]|nr:response regulator transcription factor [Phycisphaerales bacterium]
MMSQPKVYVVDDDEAVRQSLARLFSSVNLPVETFDSAASFLTKSDPDRGGCLVLDLRMPGMDGLQLQTRLNELGRHLPVIMISAHGEIETAVQAMKAGAIEFLRKPYDPKYLIERVREALALNMRIRARDSHRATVDRLRARLTPREFEVMERIVAGRSAKEIALELGLSRKTVDIHRAHILTKMQVESVVELMNLLHPPDNT